MTIPESDSGSRIVKLPRQVKDAKITAEVLAGTSEASKQAFLDGIQRINFAKIGDENPEGMEELDV